MARRLFSKPIRAKEERNGPPSADQGLSTAKPRSSHAFCTLQVHPPTSPCPTLSAGAEPKSQGHCRKWHHKLNVVRCIYASISYNWLNVTGSEKRGHFAQNVIFLPLFKLSPRQGLQSPWLPTSFTDTLGLLLHRSNVKSYSIPSVSSGELPKWGIKRAISNRG